MLWFCPADEVVWRERQKQWLASSGRTQFEWSVYDWKVISLRTWLTTNQNATEGPYILTSFKETFPRCLTSPLQETVFSIALRVWSSWTGNEVKRNIRATYFELESRNKDEDKLNKLWGIKRSRYLSGSHYRGDGEDLAVNLRHDKLWLATGHCHVGPWDSVMHGNRCCHSRTPTFRFSHNFVYNLV